MRIIRSQHPWIAAANDHAPSVDCILMQLLDNIKEKNIRGTRPVVVFDLDSTLFDVRYRTLAILKRWARTARAHNWPPGLRSRIISLPVATVQYYLKDSLVQVLADFPELDQAELLQELESFWAENFFGSFDLSWDRPISGAVEFVQRVALAGASIIYLTGRHSSGQEAGTLLSLRHWGFPAGKNMLLAMKPNRGDDDAKFKHDLLKRLDYRREILAIFDNEPANFPYFYSATPDARLIFLHSQCSNRQAESVPKIYRIFDFKPAAVQKIDEQVPVCP